MASLIDDLLAGKLAKEAPYKRGSGSLIDDMLAPPDPEPIPEEPSLGQKFTNAVGAVAPSMARGFLKQSQAGNIFAGDIGLQTDEETAASVARLEKRKEDFPMPESTRKEIVGFQQRFNNGDYWGALGELSAASVGTLLGESFGSSSASLVAGAAGGMAPMLGGRLLGGLLAAGGSGVTDYGSNVVQAFQETGVDIKNDSQVLAALKDKDKMTEIKAAAVRHAVPVAIMDGLSFSLAGMLMSGVSRSAKAAGKTVSTARKVGVGAVEVVAQGAMGAGGEALGQLNEKGEIYDKSAIALEGILEVPGGAGEIAIGRAIDRKNEKATPEEKEPERAQIIHPTYENLNVKREMTLEDADEILSNNKDLLDASNIKIDDLSGDKKLAYAKTIERKRLQEVQQGNTESQVPKEQSKGKGSLTKLETPTELDRAEALRMQQEGALAFEEGPVRGLTVEGTKPPLGVAGTSEPMEVIDFFRGKVKSEMQAKEEADLLAEVAKTPDKFILPFFDSSNKGEIEIKAGESFELPENSDEPLSDVRRKTVLNVLATQGHIAPKGEGWVWTPQAEEAAQSWKNAAGVPARTQVDGDALSEQLTREAFVERLTSDPEYVLQKIGTKFEGKGGDPVLKAGDVITVGQLRGVFPDQVRNPGEARAVLESLEKAKYLKKDSRGRFVITKKAGNMKTGVKAPRFRIPPELVSILENGLTPERDTTRAALIHQWETPFGPMIAIGSPYYAPYYKKFRAMLDTLGLNNVAVKFAQELYAPRGTKVEGVYFEKTIALAMQTGAYDAKGKPIDDVYGTFNHEMLHALRDMDYFTRQQWTMLENYVTQTRPEYYNWASRPENYGLRDEEVILEEAIAEAFRDYAVNNDKPVTQISRIFESIKQFLATVKAFFVSQNYKTAEDVFKAINDGTFRKQGEKALFDGPVVQMESLEQDGSKDWSQWFSQMEQDVQVKGPNKASPNDWKQFFAGATKRGVKQDEIDWIGINELLDSPEVPKSITKEEMVNVIRSNQLQVRDVVSVSQNEGESSLGAQLYDPENEKLNKLIDDINAEIYATHMEMDARDKEADITDLNEKANKLEKEKSELRKQIKFGPKYGFSYDAEQLKVPGGTNYQEILLSAESDTVDFRKSSHFGEEAANVLVHVRKTDRVDVQGKKVLFIEEIQRDLDKMANALRKKEVVKQAARDPALNKILDLKGWVYHSYQDKENFLNNYLRAKKEHTKLYHYMGVEKEFDVILSQADKTVSKDFGYDEKQVGARNVTPKFPFKNNFEELALKRMLRWAVDNGYDRLGWTTAATQHNRYEQRYPLKGYEDLYEKKIPQFLQKYTKKWNATFGTGQFKYSVDDESFVQDTTEVTEDFHYIDINPQMASGITKGQPMFRIKAAKPVDPLNINRAKQLGGVLSYVMDMWNLSRTNKYAQKLYVQIEKIHEDQQQLVAQQNEILKPYASLDPANKRIAYIAATIDRLNKGKSKPRADGTMVITNKWKDAVGAIEPGQSMTLNKAQADAFMAMQKWGEWRADEALRSMASNLKLGQTSPEQQQEKMKEFVDVVQEWKTHTYVPLSRFGNQMLVVRKKGSAKTENATHAEMFDVSGLTAGRTMREMQDRARELAIKYPPSEYEISSVESTVAQIQRQVNPNVLNSLDAMSSLISPQMSDSFNQLRAQFEKLTSQAKTPGWMRKAEEIPGFSLDGDMALNNAIGHFSAWAARNKFSPDADKAYAESAAEPETQAFLKKWMDGYFNPGTEFSFLKNLGFLWYLTTPSAAALNMFQTLPGYAFAHMFASPATVAKEFARAIKDAFKMLRPTREDNLYFDYKRAPPDVAPAVARAYQRGLLKPLQNAEQAGIKAKGYGSRASRPANQQNKWDKAITKTKNMWDEGIDLASSFFATTESLSRSITFIMNERLLKNPENLKRFLALGEHNLHLSEGIRDLGPNPSEEAVREFAVTLATKETQFPMGSTTRPMIMRGFGGVAFQFNQFPIMMLGLLGALTKHYGAPGKIALGILLLSFVATSGVMGLPFMDNGKDLAEGVWKLAAKENINLDKMMKDLFAHVLGTTGAEVLAKGAFRLTPIDIGERVGMGKIPLFESALSLMGVGDGKPSDALGVPWAVLTKGMMNGSADLANGMPIRAMSQLLPSTIKNPIEAAYWYNRTGVPYGKKGSIIGPGDETPVTIGEALWKAASFNPTRVAKGREKLEAMQDEKTRWQPLRDSYYSRLASIDRDMYSAQQNKDPKLYELAKEREQEVFGDITAHNRKAKTPNDMIKIDGKTRRNNMIKMIYGVEGFEKTLPKKVRAALGGSNG